MSKPYKIVLYNSGKRVKIVGSARTYSESLKLYKDALDTNGSYFPKEYDWLGNETDYELVLTGPKNGTSIKHFRNAMGALVKVKTDGDFIIKKIRPYTIEEKFKHKNSGVLYDFKGIVKKFLLGNETKVVISINNKLVIEYFEDESIDVFVLKNSSDSQRLNDTIKNFSYSNNLNNFIFFNDPTHETIRRVYDSLEDNHGISRRWMSRVSTR